MSGTVGSVDLPDSSTAAQGGVTDSATVDVAGTGSTADPFVVTADVNLDPDACNSLTVSPAGVAAPPDHTSVSGHVARGPTVALDAADLLTLGAGTSVVEDELGVLVVVNPSPCRPMLMHPHGGARVRVEQFTDSQLNSPNNGLVVRMRANGGPWELVLAGSISRPPAPDGGQEWVSTAPANAVTVPPGGALTMDRRMEWQAEVNLISERAYYNTAGITVIGTSV